MKIVGHKGSINIKNISGGRIAIGRFALSHGKDKTVNPMLFPDNFSVSLERLLAKNAIEVTKVEIKKKDEVTLDSNVVNKTTTKNEKGDEHEHVVYDPDTAKRNKLIEVESLNDNHKAIDVNYISKNEAQDFLEQHWKKIEKEVERINDVKKLEFILSVAKELGMDGNKKYELVEDRINSLK
jgi:hypothetical protein